MGPIKMNIAVLAIAVIVVLASCAPKKTEDEQGKQPINPTQIITSTDSEKGAIPHLEKMDLSNDASNAFKIKGKNPIDDSEIVTTPILINPTINAKDIYDYYINNNEAGKFVGIRFYPAYENKKLYMVMCLAEGPIGDLNRKEEKKYIALTNSFYLSPGSMFDAQYAVSKEQALINHNEYFKGVFLYGNIQTPSPAPKDTIRFSRTYEWNDFMKLVTDNNIAVGQLNQFYFQFEIGYVSNKLATIIQNRSRVIYSTEQNQGFTVLIHLKDNKGNSLIDPFSRINPEDTADKYNYKGRYLEVGHPCPPRCGVLHQ